MIREMDVKKVKEAVRQLCIEANYNLGPDITGAIADMKQKERSSLAKEILAMLEDNLDASRELNVPICQDTGMAVVFIEVGQDVHFAGGSLREAVDLGVREGYLEGYMRCSVVDDPMIRKNTGDNTPAVLHTEIVPGDRINITVAPKGFGSENMSAVKMFNPSAGVDDIEKFLLDTVQRAGGSPCPPIIVGMGIGGTFELCTLLSKKALLRPIDIRNEDPFYAAMEERFLSALNRLGVGPQGFGGDATALGVNIEKYATHIAGLPVAVNISCHVTRHQNIEL